MGKVLNSLLSGTRGRTGSIVIVNRNGLEISRARPKRPSSNFSPKQRLGQLRFKVANQLINGYKDLAINYFGKKKGQISPYNQAMSNLLNAIDINEDDETLKINYNQIAFTKGNLTEMQPIGIHSDSESQLKIEWINNSNSPKNETDQLLVLYAEEDNLHPRTYLVRSNCTRRDESYTLEVLPKFRQQKLHVWTAFISSDGKIISNSIYMGNVIIQ